MTLVYKRVIVKIYTERDATVEQTNPCMQADARVHMSADEQYMAEGKARRRNGGEHEIIISLVRRG